MKEKIILEWLEQKASELRKGKIDKMSKDHVNKFLTAEILALENKIQKVCEPVDYITQCVKNNLD